MVDETFIIMQLILGDGLSCWVLPSIQSLSLVSVDTVLLIKPLQVGWIIREVMTCIIKLALILLFILNIPEIICKIYMLQIQRLD
ncbi:hypothetical protein ABR24_16045 [Enterobacter kobei]|nr:hypothetical protein ABR24_16045 [Enterobacter kobei]